MVNKRCRSGGRVHARRARFAPPRTEFVAFKRLSLAVERAGEHGRCRPSIARTHPPSHRAAPASSASLADSTCACVSAMPM